MRTFETETMFDRETGKWVDSYFIDSCEVEEDEYFEAMADEEDNNNECTGDCDSCEFNEDEEVTECQCDECVAEREYREEVISDHLEDIQDTNGCPDCIADILVDLYELAYEDGYKDAKYEMIDIISEDLDD